MLQNPLQVSLCHHPFFNPVPPLIPIFNQKFYVETIMGFSVFFKIILFQRFV